MKASIILQLDRRPDDDGYPLAFRITQGQTRVRRTIARCWPEHFSVDAQIITDDHPEYDILAPRILELKSKAKKLILQGKYDNPEILLDKVFAKESYQISFFKYAETLIAQMNAIADEHGKRKEAKARTNAIGNIKVYENALAQFKIVCDDIPLAALDHATLLRFKNYQLSLGNKKNTVHQYLRTLRAIYNKGILFHEIADKKPFNGLFANLSVKSYANKKKYISKETILLLQKTDLMPRSQKFLDLFLLQFYFGGCDLIDLYYLEKTQLRRGRVYFERGKVGNGLMIDLKIHHKAAAIMLKYQSADKFVFPWKKDENSYSYFRKNYGRALRTIQDNMNTLAETHKDEKLKIEVLPLGGPLGSKVARHTFANIAKSLMLPEDLIRELMGHERDEVDNYYKDRYAQNVRDEALYRIIELQD